MGRVLRWTAAALALAALSGCVYAAPPPPAYGYYAPGYAVPYYYGPPVSVGLGFGWGGGWHHHDWR